MQTVYRQNTKLRFVSHIFGIRNFLVHNGISYIFGIGIENEFFFFRCCIRIAYFKTVSAVKGLKVIYRFILSFLVAAAFDVNGLNCVVVCV